MDRRVGRLLVVHPGALGDTILALPVLAALKQRYQPATLHLIGHPALVALLPGRSVVDSMTSVDGPEYQELFQEPMEMTPGSRGFWGQFDCIVVWARDSDSSIRSHLSLLKVPEVVVGSPGLRDGGRRHATDRFRDTVVHLLPSEPLPDAGVRPTDLDRKEGALWLSQNGLSPSAFPLVAVHPGSGSSSKRWPADRFAEVIKMLRNRGLSVILIEGPADGELVSTMARLLTAIEVPRLRAPPLPRVAGVLAHCRAYVGNDSGLTQLAASLGVPSVGLYGPTDPAVWALRVKNLMTLCGSSPCRCPTWEMQRDCVARVCFWLQPEQVFSALQQVLHPFSSLASDPLLC